MTRFILAAVFTVTPLAAMAGDLDGIWIGDQGRKVVVAGSEYRRCVGSSTVDGGTLAYNDHLLRTKSAQTQKVTQFVYGFDGGRLLLMASTGQLTRYSRAAAETDDVLVCPAPFSMTANASSEEAADEGTIIVAAGS